MIIILICFQDIKLVIHTIATLPESGVVCGNIIRELNRVSQIKIFMSKNFVCLFAKLICDMLKKMHGSLFIEIM